MNDASTPARLPRSGHELQALLTATEVADALNVPEERVYALAKDLCIPPAVPDMGERTYRWSPRQIQTHLDGEWSQLRGRLAQLEQMWGDNVVEYLIKVLEARVGETAEIERAGNQLLDRMADRLADRLFGDADDNGPGGELVELPERSAS